MGIFLKILLIIIALIMLISWTKVKIKITYKHDEDDDLFMIRFYAWNIKWYTFSAPLVELDKNSPSIVVNKKSDSKVGNNEEKVRITPGVIKRYLQNMRRILVSIVDFKRIITRFFRHTHVEYFEWKSVIGTSDASLTGKIIGVIWTLKGSLVSLFYRYLQVKQKPDLAVIADFQNKQSKTSLTCIISFRIGHAITAVILMMKYWKRKPLGYRTSEQVTS